MFTYSICSWSTMSYLPLLFPCLYFLLCNANFHHSYKSTSSIIFREPPQVLILIWHPPSVCAHTSLECNFLSLPLPPCAESLRSWPTPCDPMNCSPPGSSVHGILQARVLEWVAISSSRGSSQGLNLCLWSPVLAGGFFTTLTPPGKIANVWCNHWLIFPFLLNYKSRCLFLLCISNI